MNLPGESQEGLEPSPSSSSSLCLSSSSSPPHVVPNDSLTRRVGGFILGDLPDEPLTMVLQQIEEVQLLKMVTGLVSKSWGVGHIRAHVWCALGAHHNVHMTTGARMSLRSTVDQRKAFFQAIVRKTKMKAMHADALISSLWTEMRKGEIGRGKLRKVSAEACFDINHRLAMHSGWTAAFIAAWYGRLKTLKEFVTLHNASLNLLDINGFSPLSVAAWAGQTETVDWILSSGHDFGDFFQEGVPPMTSACGGKGPFSPWVWAQRKKQSGVLEAMVRYISKQDQARMCNCFGAVLGGGWSAEEVVARLAEKVGDGESEREKRKKGDVYERRGSITRRLSVDTGRYKLKLVLHQGGLKGVATRKERGRLQDTAVPFVMCAGLGASEEEEGEGDAREEGREKESEEEGARGKERGRGREGKRGREGERQNTHPASGNLKGVEIWISAEDEGEVGGRVAGLLLYLLRDQRPLRPATAAETVNLI